MAPRRAAAAAATQSMAQANQVAQAGPSGGSEPRKSSKAGTGVGLGVAAAAPLRQDPPISPIVAKLRRNWQFAAVCQFLFTFDEAFGMSGFETEALERDLDGEDLGMLPDLVRRMLYTLTLDKNIDTKNWEHYLRMQYLARSPGNNPLGSMELSRPWAAMGLTQKVKALWSLCEWQLVDSERFRKLVKSEEEPEVWRIEPVGWDSQDNTYWLFDDNRLWVQHTEPPPPPKPKALPPAKKGSKRARAEARASRKSTADKATGSPSRPASTATGAKRGRLSDVASATPAKRARASESATPARPASARSSRRLRGAPGEGEGVWEAVPSDILKPSRRARNGRGSNAYAPAGSSSESDLSEPPDEDLNGSPSSLVVAQEEVDTAHATANEDVEMADTSTTEHPTNDSQLEAPNGHVSEKGDVPVGHASVDNAQDSVPQTRGKTDAHSEVLDEKQNGTSSKSQDSNVAFSAHVEEEDGWIEFETVAVTRLEWEAIAVRFAKSKHPDEKAFHSYLQESVIPRVMADFDAVEKQRAVEAALASRKRSSRIAMKESEREERERDRAARLEMEERMARLRAEDKERRDRDREANEVLKAREERAKEREERINAREREAEERAIKEIEAREARERMREDRARKREEIIANGGIPPKHDDPRAVAASAVEHGIEPTEDESWELACEVCGKAGVNLDDSSEIVCCESCGVWQHTDCWNAFDRSVRRPARDWDQIDFYCSNALLYARLCLDPMLRPQTLSLE
ncbi:Histone acetyltransferase SAGA/ADA, catalytic subunit PCAF/GCN5 and related proteins [Ceraceosorus bombacis]|uniref:Histone acetyltransferase SAGA/ADA, catalytic subunit PCAF/GCN5 and related proteins n=1 Tax=Ceraceosorus bombacis TaxID=401625 RepID=A0A0N7LAH5_9BASI|nr:Histone acetyltransferase SAGA/ADA, catalytic subunit PCAF/GCN5 and related proteins [Ceraceosorus bombacis]